MDSAKHRTEELGGSLSLFFDKSPKAAIISATIKLETFPFYEISIDQSANLSGFTITFHRHCSPEHR
jgi:hypothetical protein